MKKNFDNFSRNLAGGVSRRKAFWQMLTGAAGIGLLATPKAVAGAIGPLDPSCPTICFQQANLAFTNCVEDTLESSPSTPFGIIISICLGAQTALYQACLTASQSCPPKMCATVKYTLNNGELNVTGVTCGGGCACLT